MTCTRVTATKRLTNRWHEQAEKFPLMRRDIPLALYIQRNISFVMEQDLLQQYEARK